MTPAASDAVEAALVRAASEHLCGLPDPCPAHLDVARDLVGSVVVVLTASVVQCYQSRLAVSGSARIATAETLMLMSQLLLPGTVPPSPEK